MEPNISILDKQLTLLNLEKLKTHWEARSNLVELFMGNFGGISDKDINDVVVGGTNECGTCCCLLGLAPEILDVDESDFSHEDFDYFLFSGRNFPYLHSVDKLRVKPIWRYLFGSDWSDDLDHALERIQNVIEGKFTPAMTLDQYFDELCEA